MTNPQYKKAKPSNKPKTPEQMSYLDHKKKFEEREKKLKNN